MKILLSTLGLLAFLALVTYYYFTSYQESHSGKIRHAEKNLILFDFDGTLCDSFEASVGVFNELSGRFNLMPIHKTDFPKYRSMPTQEFLKKHGLGKLKLPFVVYEMRKRLKQVMPSLESFPDIHEALNRLKKDGFALGILTSNSLENVEVFLRNHGVNQFDFVYHGSTLFGKERILKKIANQTKAQKIFYVGDEVRDIEACKKAKIPSIAVTWGYHSEGFLKKYDPDYMVHSFQELINLSGQLKGT